MKRDDDRLLRFRLLAGEAEKRIRSGECPPQDVDVLLQALEAFKDGQLGGVVRASSTLPVRDIAAMCEIEVRDMPFTSEDQTYLGKRGVRYVGELFYVYFDPRSAPSRHVGERIMEVIYDRFGLRLPFDPIAAGWRPSYWNNAALIEELNALILERHPTPAPLNREISAFQFNWRQWKVDPQRVQRHGIARTLHYQHIHYVGEILTQWLQREHTPRGMHSSGALPGIRSLLTLMRSRLWAGFLMPPAWTPPDWLGSLWRAELDAMAKEKRGAELPDQPLLRRPITTLQLSVRTTDALQKVEIETLRDLVAWAEADLLKSKVVGRRALKEIKEALKELNLRLGMTPADFL